MPRGQGRIAFASVTLASSRIPLDFTFEGSLESSVATGLPVTRYGRTWRIGRVVIKGNVLTGRMGYDRAAGTEAWDEKAQDFRDIIVQEGKASPFALDLLTGEVAFQLRGSDIKSDTFTWNFQALLNAGSKLNEVGVRWRVRPDLHGEPFEEFIARAERVTMLDFTLLEPNPHYGKRRRVEALVADTGSRMTRVVMTADPDDIAGINVDASFVQQAVEHVKMNYGKVRVDAEVAEGGTVQPERWRSEVEGSPRVSYAGVDPTTGEVSPGALTAEVESEPPEE
jgi:hypothetical protein